MRSKTISTLNTINVAGTPVALSDGIKILGVVFDKNLTFDFRVSHVSKSCFYHIRALRHIRPALTDDVAKMVACSLVGSRLYYANSVLFGTSAKNLARLHHIQATLARRAGLMIDGAPARILLGPLPNFNLLSNVGYHAF